MEKKWKKHKIFTDLKSSFFMCVLLLNLSTVVCECTLGVRVCSSAKKRKGPWHDDRYSMTFWNYLSQRWLWPTFQEQLRTSIRSQAWSNAEAARSWSVEASWIFSDLESLQKSDGAKRKSQRAFPFATLPIVPMVPISDTAKSHDGDVRTAHDTPTARGRGRGKAGPLRTRTRPILRPAAAKLGVSLVHF